MIKSIKLIGVILLLFVPFKAVAQLSLERSVIASAGANQTSDLGFSATWTAGETVIGTNTDGTIVLTQGFQQSDEVGLSVEDFQANLNFSVYPNPTKGEVFVEVDASKAMTLHYMLYDLLGRKIPLPNNTQQIEGHAQKRLDLSNLAEATYLLVITDQSNRALTNIRIIKAANHIKN